MLLNQRYRLFLRSQMSVVPRRPFLRTCTFSCSHFRALPLQLVLHTRHSCVSLVYTYVLLLFLLLLRTVTSLILFVSSLLLSFSPSLAAVLSHDDFSDQLSPRYSGSLILG